MIPTARVARPSPSKRSIQARLLSLQGEPGRSSMARVERAHSDRARSASRRTTRLPAPFFSILLKKAVFFEIVFVYHRSRLGGNLSSFLQQTFDVFPD